MECQVCKNKEAAIVVKLNINGNQEQLPLCQECFINERNKLNTPSGFQGFSQFPFEHMFQGSQSSPESKAHRKQTQHGGNGGLLDQFGRNITHAAKAGLIDPVIGRDKEINRVIEILNRRNKNNPVLIGEPGVGKTAIAEGLALKIADNNVPPKLLNKEVYLLDVASLVANTGVRGQFEDRIKKIIGELQRRKNIILFIDEIHLLVGAGSAEGSMDAGNILKPALARGELQLVGATTLNEYRKIEKDAALERRFQPVTVAEPTNDEAVQILHGIKEKYEDYHHVKYTDEAITQCVTLSHRYIQDRFLPDKAIDLLDEAGSKINLEFGHTDEQALQDRLSQLTKEKEIAASEENYEEAANLRHEEIKLEKQLKDQNNVQKALVNTEVIQEIIEEKTGIPVGKLQQDEHNRMKNLEKNLSSKVIGQEEAVKKVAKAIRRSRAGLKAKHRPIGSFLFVGPTGVGKTELTKTLAEELFGSKDMMIRFDMSEFMEKHSVSKLIGSPPGYVGHEDAGQLTEKVRRNPYSIILLDEIEKAHPDVQHMFLQILEDGRLTDSQGRTVSFKDTVIIMTSNAGTTHKTITVGFEHSGTDAIKESNILNTLGSFFKPEFLNRFDSIIEFNQLEKAQLQKIVELLISELEQTLKDQNLILTVSPEAIEKIAELGYHPQFGARPLRRVIQEQLEDLIADLLLEKEGVTEFHTVIKAEKIAVKPVEKQIV
ncbi:ATP-dependent Clp protease ATP-binding subunit [Cytobacillus sp. IB215665]|uniref:ATP-dependent Clp protease ATP-binding subunit n=1 Tax=Cytobacillus sp. IB215665 TaxID=3097357 RepID=UPI002A0CC4A2|nr:ATP-dependent Clp protease ATP-binding subunit [Cytobacillus sp. IB215665]MDX8365744.1 ATP-dependent Clp protease ATP-binding subunit [Cytobacillus sp. IB215665]